MSRTGDALGVFAIVVLTTATLSLGGWAGYKAGVAQGEANTMNDFVNRCLDEPVPAFCQAMLDEFTNATASEPFSQEVKGDSK